jgi:predicted nucleic acid-binding Zn ribbon protein
VFQDDEQIADVLADFERRRRRARARFAARSPRRAGDVVADVIRVRGYARVTSQRTLEKAWRQAVAELVSGVAATSASRPGNVRRGVLMVWVANSAVNQELTFQKRALLARLGELLPEVQLRDLRIRVGKVC